MARNYSVRKQEILDKAASLFYTHGYEQTTVQQILEAAGIGKGTFYYYFDSKESLLDAMIESTIDGITRYAETIVQDQDLTTAEKMTALFLPPGGDVPREQELLLDSLHEAENAKMHLRSLTRTIQRLSPLLEILIEEGIAEGLFATDYPGETMELLLVSASFLFDEGIFTWSEVEVTRRMKAFIGLMENGLGARPGSLAFMESVLRYGGRSLAERT